MQRIVNSDINADKNMSLYLHIPFCVSKCTYCDFCSFVAKPKIIKDYIQALSTEITTRAKEFEDKTITSIYIGGGTPSILPSGALAQIIQLIRTSFNVSYCSSLTVEANPNSFTHKLAQELMDAGVTRLSFGLQTHSKRLLKLLNRPHTYLDFERAIAIATQVGFTDINADILLGIPTQTKADLQNTLHKLIKLPLTHISAYGLILEPNTPLTLAVQNGELPEIDEDTACDMYNYTVTTLNKSGFNRYEISNFAIPGCESTHNLNYWARGQYLGLGLASHSFVNGYHWQNTNSLDTYLNSPTNSYFDVERETITTAKLETIMLALRTTTGLDIKEFNQKFNANFMQEYHNILTQLLEQDLITIKDHILTIKDYNLSNSIIAMFA